MAYATEITIGTGSKVSVNYQSQEVNVGVTYHLEREDENLLQIVESKAAEVEAAHRRLWKTIKSERDRQDQVEQGNGQTQAPAPAQSQAMEGQPPSQNGSPPNGSSGYANGQANGNGNGNVSHNGGSNAYQAEAAPVNGNYSNGQTAVQEAPPSNGYADSNGSSAGEAAMTQAQERAVYALTKKINMAPEEVLQTLRMRFAKNNLQQLTKRQASQFIDELQRKERSLQERR